VEVFFFKLKKRVLLYVVNGHSGDYALEYLPNFGYKPNMEVFFINNKKESFYILGLPTRTSYKNL